MPNTSRPPAQAPDHVQQPEEKRGTILVVEDDSFLRTMLVRKLRKERFDVREAVSGQEALDFLARELPLLMLLDLMIPEIDGFQVLEAIRSNSKTRDMPVIVLSNISEEKTIQRARDLGADDYLIKAHFMVDEIVERISIVLAKRYV